MKCAYNGCKHKARWFMCWENENGQHCGLVCATHDKLLGRKNLIKLGWTLKEAVLFDRYCKTVPDEEGRLDYPEWLKKYICEKTGVRTND